MGVLGKQIAIYLSLALVCAAYTMLSPFYPDIALRKGVPLWCVGIIFSTDPFCGFFTALVVSKYMNQFGRKNVILWSQVFLAISMFTLSPIQFLDLDAVLLLSFLSRMFAGIGTGCVMTAAASVFASEYPENTPVMIGRMQGAIGIGLIIGPILGTLLVLESLFFALIVLGSLIALLIPISWKMLGEFRPYQIIDTSNTSTFQIFKIPVRKTLENYSGRRDKCNFIVLFRLHQSDFRNSFIEFPFELNFCIIVFHIPNDFLHIFFYWRGLCIPEIR